LGPNDGKLVGCDIYNKMTTLIYSLEKNGIPFYIGKTRSSQGRFNSHRRIYKCEINIIDEVPTSEWRFWEKHYISLYKSWGFELENKNEGGGGLTYPVFSKERNMKISIATKGRKISDEQKMKLRILLIGNKYRLGKKHSEETKEKIRLKLKGKKVSDETKLKKSISMKGKKHSKETKEKISKSLLGKSKSDEHKIKLKNKSEIGLSNIRISKSKPVLQYDLQGNFIKEWPSVTKANHHIKGDIYACCTGKQLTAGMFKWKYKNS